MDREERGIEINFIQIAKKLLENVKYLLAVTVIFGVLGYVGTAMFITPVYQASAKMIVNSRNDNTANNITNDQLNSSRNLVETYAIIIRGRDVLNQVINDLELQENYKQLASAVSVKSVNNTPVMQISVNHTDRDTALKIVAKLLEIAPAILVETTEAGSVKAVEQAYADPGPVSPSRAKNAVLMAVAGFMMTCLAIFILMMMDNTYKTDIDIQRDLELPVLGVIPAVESCRAHSNNRKIRKEEVAK